MRRLLVLLLACGLPACEEPYYGDVRVAQYRPDDPRVVGPNAFQLRVAPYGAATPRPVYEPRSAMGVMQRQWQNWTDPVPPVATAATAQGAAAHPGMSPGPAVDPGALPPVAAPYPAAPYPAAPYTATPYTATPAGRDGAGQPFVLPGTLQPPLPGIPGQAPPPPGTTTLELRPPAGTMSLDSLPPLSAPAF